MPLTIRERTGSRRLLESLDTADLFSLAGTVTKKKSTACTRAGAIDTILQNSKSANELLNRRKVSCHINAEYLKNEGVPIHPNITKADLIEKTLAHWSGQDFFVPMVTTFTPSSRKQQSKASGYHFSHPFYLHASESPIQSPLEDTSKTWDHGTPTTDLDTEPHMTTHSILRPATFEAKNEKLSATLYRGVMEVEDASWICPVNCEQFAEDFCEWFFTVLNSQQQSSRLQRKDWGPQHFVENAELQLMYMSTRRKYTGGTSTSSHLLALVQEEGLLFLPNISSKDLKCERSPQGVMVVMVSGTIFRNKSYLGTFDQVFEVVGNSRTNNWKILNIDLKIQIRS